MKTTVMLQCPPLHHSPYNYCDDSYFCLTSFGILVMTLITSTSSRRLWDRSTTLHDDDDVIVVLHGMYMVYLRLEQWANSSISSAVFSLLWAICSVLNNGRQPVCVCGGGGYVMRWTLLTRNCPNQVMWTLLTRSCPKLNNMKHYWQGVDQMT